MIKFSFTIHGNHANEKGNPKPKARFTFRQQRTGRADEYHEYLDYVRGCFLDALEKKRLINKKEFRDFFYVLGPKPLHTGKRKCRMSIFITWANDAHGDPENIFGAIADALFENDKYLAVAADFDPKPRGAGRVDVDIEIYD